MAVEKYTLCFMFYDKDVGEMESIANVERLVVVRIYISINEYIYKSDANHSLNKFYELKYKQEFDWKRILTIKTWVM